MRPLAAIVAAALALAGCASGPAPARDRGGLLLGITAPTDYEAAVRDGASLGAALTASLGKPVEVVVLDRYEQLAAAVAAGDVDLAWLPPLAYLRAREQAAVTPLRRAVRRGSVGYRSVIFARADRKLGGLPGLAGARMAWVDPQSASGYLVPAALLVERGTPPAGLFLEQGFLGNHEAVCQAVYEGTHDAGAVFSDEADVARGAISACAKLLRGEPGVLAILGASEPLPSDLVAARPGLAPATAAEAAAALDRLLESAAGRAAVAALFEADGLAPASDEDLAPLRRALARVPPPP